MNTDPDADPDAPDNLMVRQLDRIANDLESLLNGTYLCAALLALLCFLLAVRVFMEL